MSTNTILTTESLYRFSCFVNGAWRESEGETWQTFDPAHPIRQVGAYSFASTADAEEAILAAKVAQREWRGIPQAQRAARVEKFVALIEANAAAIARAIVAEQGKPMSEACNEVTKACGESRAMIAVAMGPQGVMMAASRPGFVNEVRYRPRGIIVALTPWNFPIMTPMRKVAPALVFGNAIILKPSEYTPAAVCMIADYAKGILPDGLLQILIGGGDLGSFLVSHPDVDGVTFTGSVEVGRRVYQSAAQHLAEVSLELGGKNAAIIHDPVDLDIALDDIVVAAFACGGQRCTGISRVLVARPLAEKVLSGLKERVESLVIGAGAATGTMLGPLIHEPHRRKVTQMVQDALLQGARLVTGGKPLEPAAAPEGFFYAPTILTDIPTDAQIAVEEVFGPVLTVQVYDDFKEALALVNSVVYGLTSALFSASNHIVQRFLADCETGMLHVNHGTVPDNNMPFGGIKASGVGAYSVGPSARQFYMTEHATYIRPL